MEQNNPWLKETNYYKYRNKKHIELLPNCQYCVPADTDGSFWCVKKGKRKWQSSDYYYHADISCTIADQVLCPLANDKEVWRV